jgi:hypothetical protein
MLKKTGLVSLMTVLFVFAAQAITITGAVTNVANNQPVVGAIVTFQSGMNTYADTTIAGGAYTLTGIPNTVTAGLLTVNATGFGQSRQIANNLTATNTVDVALTPTGTGTGLKNIHGLVTDASANAVSGARLILLLRAGGGVLVYTPVDTVNSAADGRYRFDSLASGRYEIEVSKAGFLDTTVAGLDIRTVDSLVTNVALRAVGTSVGTLTGKVTATDTSVLIANAKLLLTRTTGTGGIVTIDTLDSAMTNANGVYTVSDVVVGTGYRLIASATGYVTSASNTFRVDSAVTRTQNFRLTAVVAPAGIVKGTVTDSSDLSAVAGAQVVLRMQGAAFNWQRIDSMQTAANGSFSFTGLAVGTYSLVVSKADYRTYTTPFNQAINLTTNPDTATVAVVLSPVAKGNLHVFVRDNANAAIAGVAVTAVQRVGGGGGLGQTYTGATAANGWVTFSDVIAGNYDVTASKTGFNTATSAGNTVPGNGNDTVRITLNTATGTSKVVKGTITSGGANLAGAVITLTARTGGGGGGGVLTLIDTSGADGSFAIPGIPAGYTNASLGVAKSGYVTKDTTGVSIANDTTTVVISLSAVAVIPTSANLAKAELRVTMSRSGICLQTGEADVPTHVTLFSVNGRTILDRTVTRSGASLIIPRTWSNQVLLLTVRQGNRIIRQKVTLQ